MPRVRPFAGLTRLGQARRLRRTALAALASYGIGVTDVRLLAAATNTLFRVRTTAGNRYVLRCCSPGWRTDTDLRSEAMWLEALARDTDIGAPLPVRTLDGDAFQRIAVEGVPTPVRCTLMSWIPGVPLGRRLSIASLAAMGELFARIHAHGAAFVPPDGFTTRRMSWYLARGEVDTLFSSNCLEALPRSSQELLTLALARVSTAFADRYADPSGLCVIHNDLWHDNIKLSRGRLRPLDFEDTLWGYPVQDIAMAWLDLMDGTTPSQYTPYLSAFREGYERSASWPEKFAGEIDLFEAGRLLWVANYVATHQPQYLQIHIAHLAPRLNTFLTSGRIPHPARDS